MRNFVKLIKEIDSSTSSNRKIEALVHYLIVESNEKDKLWLVAFFTGRKPSRGLSSSQLRTIIAELTQLPLWLIEDTYHSVGDLAETMALLAPKVDENVESIALRNKFFIPTFLVSHFHDKYIHNDHAHDKIEVDYTLDNVMLLVLSIKQLSEEKKKEVVLTMWKQMNVEERFIFNKFLTGGFRIGVSKQSLIKALAKYLQKEENVIAHRLMGSWNVVSTSFNQLLVIDGIDDAISKPYPFLLAYALEEKTMEETKANQWAIEYKWDGIRAQIIKRDNQLFVWSRGEELITDHFPEFDQLKDITDIDFVLDGELVVYKDRPLDFQDLQQRINRKTVSKKMLESLPAAFIAYDILEYNKTDIRHESYLERRKIMGEVVDCLKCNIVMKSEFTICQSWEEIDLLRRDATAKFAEGIMLKGIDSTYDQGRRVGLWWKWKIEPYTADVVLLYAQKGHGRRANLFTDFTFATWGLNEKGESILLPITKAYSGLTDKEFEEITKFVRKNTIAKYGPVYSVEPTLVFEIAFEGIAYSTRHKSGIALRFPRIKRWRTDKKAEEADNLDYFKKLIDKKLMD